MGGDRREESEELAETVGADPAVSNTERSPDSRPTPADQSLPPHIGRFEVVRQIGDGAMGIVYEARDPQLGRHVAVKVMRDIDATDDSAARTKREAQALARLSHPNIVTVHEVGHWLNGVFIVMELIEGTTLRSWMDAGPRPWREVLELFGQIGRGLVAAHRAEVVHRDFKPENVLIGHDGRPRIVDFGLARHEVDTSENREVSDDDAAALAETGEQDSLATPLTRTGAILGTPAYMAPEQHAGAEAGVESDQFSFCVTLWEALYGARPFSGSTRAEVARAASEGSITAPSPSRAAPTWVRATIERGLAADAADRYSSLAQLLDVFERKIGQRRRRAMIAAAVLVTVTLGGATAYSLTRDASSGSRACTPAADRLAGVWNDSVRASIAKRFAAHDDAFVANSWKSVLVELDPYAESWAKQYDHACASPDDDQLLHAQRMTCLEGRLLELDAMSAYLQDADARSFSLGTVGNLIDAEPAECNLEAVLRAQLPAPPAEIADTLREAQRQFHLGRVRTRAALNAGDVTGEQGLETLRQATLAIEQLGYEPAMADALASLGSYESRVSDDGATLRRAIELAERTRNDRALSFAAGQLVRTVPPKVPDTGAYDIAAGAALISQAKTAFVRAGSPPSLAGYLLEAEVHHWVSAGDAERALEIIDAHERNAPVRDPFRFSSLRHDAYFSLGQYRESLRWQRAVAAAWEERLGKEHPMLMKNLEYISYTLQRLGDQESIAVARQALALARTTYTDEHTAVEQAVVALTRRLMGHRRNPEIVALLDPLLAKTKWASQNMELRSARVNAYFDQGRHTEAYELAAQLTGGSGGAEVLPAFVEAIAAARSGDHATAIAFTAKLEAPNGMESARQYLLALVFDQAGAHDRALAAAMKALESGVPPAPEAADMRIVAGLSHLALRRPGEAATLLTKAVEALDRYPGDVGLASAKFGLARALWESGGDRAEALDLARSALSAYEARADGWAPEREAIRAWLAAR
jgi:predicted Ser/Thr protein kinase